MEMVYTFGYMSTCSYVDMVLKSRTIGMTCLIFVTSLVCQGEAIDGLMNLLLIRETQTGGWETGSETRYTPAWYCRAQTPRKYIAPGSYYWRWDATHIFGNSGTGRIKYLHRGRRMYTTHCAAGSP